MTEFLDFFVYMWSRFLDLLGSVNVELYGYKVNILAVLFVILIIGFVISVFWKGAKT